MGYRSDVAFTIRFVDDHDEKNKQSFYVFLAEAKEKIPFAFADESYCEVEVDERNFAFNFRADSIKWYDSYPEVQAMEALWSLGMAWSESNETIAGRFARVGEDNNDNDERDFGNNDYDWVHVSRQVITSWS
jgi:hypothetical protein